MHPHVHLQRSGSIRGILAATRPGTLEGPVTTMRPLVNGQGITTCGGEDAPDPVTPETILGGSVPQLTVSSEIAALRRRVVTVLVHTLEGLIARMRPHVTSNGRTLGRRIGTAPPTTGIGSLPRMRPHMRLQVVALPRSVTTSGPLTHIRSLPGVYPTMREKIAQLFRGIRTAFPPTDKATRQRNLRTHPRSPLRCSTHSHRRAHTLCPDGKETHTFDHTLCHLDEL